MHASNTLHSLAYVHTVCVCVFVSVFAHIDVCVFMYGVISLCLGRGHIHVFVSVPSGQMQLSCLLKQDTMPSTKLKTDQPTALLQNRKSHFMYASII